MGLRRRTLAPTAGQRSEAGFGLMDYNARYYDPLLGRFVSADTVVPEPWSAGAFNRYTYVYNNPLRYTDPTGHCVGAQCLNRQYVYEDPQVGPPGGGAGAMVAVAALLVAPIVINSLSDVGFYDQEGFSLGVMPDPLAPERPTLGGEFSGPTTYETPLNNNDSPRIFALPFPSDPGIELPNVWVASSFPTLTINDKQFGKKLADHHKEWGLDPSSPTDRDWFRERIEDIGSNPEEVRQGFWRPWTPNAIFYKQGSDVVVANDSGSFVTILRGGVKNTLFKAAKVIYKP